MISEVGRMDLDAAFTPITLPCGRTIPNRFVKVAMYEHLATLLGGPPNASLNALYKHWAQGGWGIIVTGNVQVDERHLSLGRDVVIPKAEASPEVLERFKEWARFMKGLRNSDDETDAKEECVHPLAIMQLNHTGRQSPNFIGGRLPFVAPLSASATRVGSSSRTAQSTSVTAQWISHLAYALLFQRAREMTRSDIVEVISAFVRGARLAVDAGFDGVQLHAAHGYLLAQFISRKTNLRNDEYAHSLAVLKRVVTSIRAAVPSRFIVGIKLNASDYATDEGNSDAEKEALKHIREIGTWGVDFIEISGGDYERPEFTAKPSERQAFFESFSRMAVSALSPSTREHPTPLILLTGGLRTPSHISSVLRNNHAHLLGLGRLSVMYPDFPLQLKTRLEREPMRTCIPRRTPFDEFEAIKYPEPRTPAWWPRIIGAGVGTGWYTVAMKRMARSGLKGRRVKMPYGLGTVGVLVEMWLGIDGGLVEKWGVIVLIAVCLAVLSVLARIYS